MIGAMEPHRYPSWCPGKRRSAGGTAGGTIGSDLGRVVGDEGARASLAAYVDGAVPLTTSSPGSAWLAPNSRCPIRPQLVTNPSNEGCAVRSSAREVDE
jgi:hypothetical protein